MITRALIIASDDCGLQNVYGEPAVKRLVMLALHAGLKVHITARSEAASSVLSQFSEKITFNTLKGQGVKDAISEIGFADKEDVLILKANHVIDRKTFNFIIEMSQNSDFYIFESEGHGYADPVYSVPAECAADVAESICTGEILSQDVLSRAKFIHNFHGIPYLMAEGDCRGRVAEEKLMNVLASQTSQTDGFMSRYFDRHISRFISKILLKTPITPNLVTLIGVTIGLLSAYMFAAPGYFTGLAGALFFVLCIVFDGVDGEIARLKLKESTFGHYLDIITDNVVHVAIFLGISVGLYRQTENYLFINLFWVLIIGFVFCAVSVYFCVLCKSEEELKRQPLLMRLMALLTNRDFAYIILLFAVFDKLNWFFIGAAFGTYLFAVVLWGFDYYEKSSKKLTEDKADR